MRRPGIAARRLLLSLAFLPATGVPPAFAFRNLSIPSTSMLPTLGVGDIVTAEFYGVDYAALAAGKPFDPKAGEKPDFQPQRGDIVAFQLAGQPVFVKRIVGLGGDRVQMRGGRLFLNGTAVAAAPIGAIEAGCPERAVSCTFFRETLPEGANYVTVDMQADSPGDDTEEFLVPPDRFFMLGDNRDNSNDSRFGTSDFGMFGTVPRSALIGRIARIVASPRSEPPAAERLQGFPNAK
ncbi:signal peptidase I [Aureimonas leprariae]|nr:signal peptidase I [Aureimonas leprariae]